MNNVPPCTFAPVQPTGCTHPSTEFAASEFRSAADALLEAAIAVESVIAAHALTEDESYDALARLADLRSQLEVRA